MGPREFEASVQTPLSYLKIVTPQVLNTNKVSNERSIQQTKDISKLD